MDLAIGLLTLVLVLDSLFLMLLILIQLPKKEAGIGVAFGGSATDALFGAGSGTALSKITKYSAAVFLTLSLVLSVMRTHHAKTSARIIATELERKAVPTTPTPATSTLPPPVTLPTLPAATTNVAPTQPTTGTTSPPPAQGTGITTNTQTAGSLVVTNAVPVSAPGPQ
ncbi:MAG: preprotein translocase subunit SecG [Verrucomicrobiae bacterium]|nr:preprotein translocase subunit SecG [Verrucomicrobiae bacterium]